MAVKSNLIHSVELESWVKYREFVAHLHGMLDRANFNNQALIIEVWEFPRASKEEATKKGKRTEIMS